MFKRCLTCLVCLLLLLMTAAGCNPAPAPDGGTDAPTEAADGTGETAPGTTEPAVTDVPTDEDVTEAPTETPTEAVTEAETEPPFIPTTYEEHKAEIYRKTDNKVVLGGFLTPVGNAYVEPALTALKEAGINMVVTQNEFYGTALMANTLRVADKLDMDLNIWVFGPHIVDAATATDRLKQALGHPCVKYIYLQDEPLLESLKGLKDEAERIRAAYGGEVNWKLGANMYPYQVLYNWDTVVQKTVSDVKVDWICFDMYPFSDGNNGMAGFLTNLAWEMSIAKPAGVDCWAYLQTTQYGNIDAMTEAQLRYQTNAVMAMGADGAMCFMATATDVNHIAILHENGTPDDRIYPNAKAVFTDLNAMKGVYLPYDTEVVLFGGESAIVNSINEKVPGFASADTSWGCLANAEGSHYMIGCMKHGENGNPGLYVVNTKYTDGNNTVTLHFDGTHTYQLWNRNGLEVMGEADSLTLDLVPGEGCFIALDVSNDATTYPEPEAEPAAEAPSVTPIEKGTMFLDIGVDESGKIVNKAENGLGLKAFSSGEVLTEDGRQVLSKYDIWTDDAQNAVANGITVEMYVKLTAKANRAWIIFFKDLSGNGNLNRKCDKGNDKGGTHYYHGSYDDNDVMLKGDIEQYLPSGEWLHIVSVVSDAGQYVYVNGKLLSEGHFANPAPEFSTFVISETKGVCLLDTVRMYACAKTADEVQEMYNQFK